MKPVDRERLAELDLWIADVALSGLLGLSVLGLMTEVNNAVVAVNLARALLVVRSLAVARAVSVSGTAELEDVQFVNGVGLFFTGFRVVGELFGNNPVEAEEMWEWAIYAALSGYAEVRRGRRPNLWGDKA